MKNIEIFVLSILLWGHILAGQLFAATQFEGGGIYDIEYYTGSIGIDWRPTDTSTTVNLLTGGSLNNGNFIAFHNSRLNIFGGTVNSGNLVALDYSQITFSSGLVTHCNFGAENNSLITMKGGNVSSCNFHIEDNSRIDFIGGTINDSLVATETSQIYMSGGLIKYGLVAADYSHFVWTGGIVGMLTVSRDATIEIYGSNFAIEGVPIGGSVLKLVDFLGDTDFYEYRLTGTLANGDAINTIFYAYTVPEPTTFALLGLGVLLQSIRKK